MSLLLIEELAKQLELPVDDVNTALSELVQHVKSDLDNQKPAQIPGIGTFEQVDGTIAFNPADALAMAVNNRYAALDSEMIQLGFEEPEFPLSESFEEGNDQEIDQSLIDQIIADDIGSQDLFKDTDASANQIPIDAESPFDEDLIETDLELTNSPTNDASTSEPEVEPASMKEDDPNTNNNSKQDPLGSDTEWSPFFEELEGEEFDIDNTIDLSAEDWQAEIPTPPSSPFASSSDSSNANTDDLYFDVDADPDDTLFAPAASIDVEDPSNDDLSWASAPLDDVTDFFEDDPSMSSSFGEEADAISSLSAEDEFFSPVSGSVNASPDDTMFSPESIYSEEASTEADDTIFLAPDQTVQAKTEEMHNQFTPQAEEQAAAAPPPRNRNPYAYREQRKKSTSAFPWVAAVIAAVLIIGGGTAYFMGWLPFGSADTPPQNISSVAPGEGPEETPGTELTTPVDPAPNTTENTLPPETGAETPATTPEPLPEPTIQRVDIDRSRGGWTVVVTSKEDRFEAEEIADNFAQKLSGSLFPIGILTTNDFANIRYRVGVGQFSTREEARAFITRSGSDLPGDAWLLRIE